MTDRVPPLLTVEEAARHLRIGRTKAYALATEWRITGGKSGLPVVDFGHVLRVPRHQLELLIGGPLDVFDQGPESSSPSAAVPTVLESERAEASAVSTAPTTPVEPQATKRNGQRNRDNTRRDNQLDLFNRTATD